VRRLRLGAAIIATFAAIIATFAAIIVAPADANDASSVVAVAGVAVERTFKVVNEAIFEPWSFEIGRSMRPFVYEYTHQRMGARQSIKKRHSKITQDE